MKIMTGTRALLVMCLGLGGAVSAHAATYTLTCDAARSGSFTLVLTGFTLKVANSGETGASSGMSVGARTSENFELTIRVAVGKDYAALMSMVQDDEVLRSCKLLDTEGGSEIPTSSEVSKSKNKNKNNAQTANTSNGALEWIFSNASVTSVTAIGNESTTGEPEGRIEATIKAQSFSFTM